MTRARPRSATLAALLLVGWIGVAGTGSRSPAASAADSGTVPMYRGNAARTGEDPGPGPSGSPSLRWKVRLGQFLSSSPAVAAGVVYIGSIAPSTLAGGALHAVDAETGEELWRAATDPGDGLFSSPAVVDGTVYVGSYDGVVIAVSTSGTERWRFQTAGPVFSSPAVVDGIVYLGDDTGRLYALDAGTGALRWSFIADRPYERGMAASPAVVAGIVYAVSSARRTGKQSYLHALDAVTGEERWRFAAPEGGNLRGTPVVASGHAYVTTGAGIVYAVDPESGHERWRFDAGAPTSTQLAAAADTVFLATDDAVLHAIDAASGASVWSHALADARPFASSPTLARGVLYVGDAGGILYAVDAGSGEERWSAIVHSYISTPAIVGGMIYIGGDDGILRAIGGAPSASDAVANAKGGPSSATRSGSFAPMP